MRMHLWHVDDAVRIHNTGHIPLRTQARARASWRAERDKRGRKRTVKPEQLLHEALNWATNNPLRFSEVQPEICTVVVTKA